MALTSETTCVIGDIHGCHAALQQLLPLVRHQADTIVFLGDYVDRGPSSREVLTTLIRLTKEHANIVPLLGNHDQLFLQYLEGEDRAASALFLRVGGVETLASYGLSATAQPAEIAQHVPPEHIAFLQSLPYFWEDEHAIYVHAGLQPGRHLSQQSSQWCLWARNSFLQTTCNFGKPVVFGHTVFPEPLMQDDKIGIDTGAVYGGRLTALLLPEKKLISVPGEMRTTL